MSQPRECPHCGHNLPFSNEYVYDHELNMYCGKCGKIIFPTTTNAEIELFRELNSNIS